MSNENNQTQPPTQSKTGLMIRHDNGEVKVFDSKFEKQLGDTFNIDGVKYKVCKLTADKKEAGVFLAKERKAVFSYYDYNKPNGNVYTSL